MRQRGIIWSLLVLLVVLCVYGLVVNRPWHQPIWAPEGLHRFLIFAAIYAGIVICGVALAPRWLLPAMAAGAFLYSGLAVGWLAPLAVAYIGAGCYALGVVWFRRAPNLIRDQAPLVIVTGLATWVSFVLLTARWPLHHTLVYWLAPLIPIYYALRNQHVPTLRGPAAVERHVVAAQALALFPLFCHWLVALEPEISADGLAMHMVIPARMAARGAWTFDPSEFAWAVMPMGGDWAWSIAWLLGGEAAARLLNVALLGLIAWMVWDRLHTRVPAWTAAALLAALLSTPLVQLVTGSLFVENFAAVLILGAVLLLRIYAKQRRPGIYMACALLCGVAAASKFGAWAFVVPLLIAAMLAVKLRTQLAGLAIVLLIGSAPYVEAWFRTGNPLFPFFNATFKSPYFPIENLRDARFLTPLSWHTLYDLTFHTSRFIEGQDGGAGYFYFLFVPLALVGWRRHWPRVGLVLMWVGLAGSALTLAGQSNLRYIYAALPLFTVLAGVLIASIRAHAVALGNTLGGVAAAVALLNLAFLPAAGYYHKDFYTNRVLAPSAVKTYVLHHAPERVLVVWLNAHAPSSRVAWLDGNAIADFRGRPFTNSWHSEQFCKHLREARNTSDVTALCEELKINYFIAHSAGKAERLTNVHSLSFLLDNTEPITAAGDVELRRWRRGAGMPQRVYAQPGEYDELNAYTRYEGPWTRDLQFTEAWHATLAYSNNNTSRVTIRFHGNAVRLRYTAAANRCLAQVQIDGGAPEALNQYAPATRWATLSQSFRAASQGDHELLLRFPPSDRVAAVGGCFIDLDGFQVE